MSVPPDDIHVYPPEDGGHDLYWGSASPSADSSCEVIVQECLGLILTVSHHTLYGLQVAVQLRFGNPKHLDPLHLDDLVLGARKDPLENVCSPKFTAL